MDLSQRTELLTAARRAAEHAYVPYSQFPVGAALLVADGSIVTGCNVENASYGLTICAERVAATTAIAAGYREFIAVAVSAPKVALTTPCGACRQFLNEFRPIDGDLEVILDDRAEGVGIGLDQLLPRAFGPRNLEEASLSATKRATESTDRAG